MSVPFQQILLIDNSLYLTGALRSILNYATALKDQCRFVFVLPQNSKAVAIVEASGFKVYTLPFLEVSKSLKSIFYLPRLNKNANALLRIIKAEQINIVHVNDVYNMLGCMIKRKQPSIPVVYHVRLLASSYIRQLYPYFAKMVKRYADKIICVSEAVQKDIGESKKSSVVYDAIQIKENLPLWNGLQDAQQAKILYLANFVNGKGQQYAVQAFKEVLQHFPGTTLHFAGGMHHSSDELFRQSLQQQAVDLGIEKQVFFEGPTSNVEATMKAHDILLNLSESESFSMVSLEALVYGVPLVVSDCGGPREITDNGQYGLLVPNRDAGAAGVALRSLLTGIQQSKERAEKGKAFAKQKFNLEQNLKQLLEIYRQAVVII